MTTATVKVYPPEFRWGRAPAMNLRGGLWLARGLTVGDDIVFDDSLARFISLGAPLFNAGGVETEASFLSPKPHRIHTLALLFDVPFAGGASASFAFNVNGSTHMGLTLDLVTGEQSKVATGLVTVAQLDEVCLECTAAAGGTPNLRAISIAYNTRAGDDPTV